MHRISGNAGGAAEAAVCFADRITEVAAYLTSEFAQASHNVGMLVADVFRFPDVAGKIEQRSGNFYRANAASHTVIPNRIRIRGIAICVCKLHFPIAGPNGTQLVLIVEGHKLMRSLGVGCTEQEW